MVTLWSARMADHPFSRWFNEERERRKLSERDFATLMKLPYSTVHKLLNWPVGTGKYPELGTLIPIARETGMDVCSLVDMFISSDTQTRARLMAIAARIDALNPVQKEIVDRYILGSDLKGTDEA